jgi:outer membrane protein OmpA-like peptidoglycan-associated protein
MKYISILYLVLFIVFFNPLINAQKTKQEIKGDKYYSYKYFSKAITKYKSSKSLTVDSKRNLADALKKTGNYKDSELCNQQIISSPELNAFDILNYYYILKMNGNYKDSDKSMGDFLKLRSFDSRAQSHIFNSKNLENLLKEEGRYAVKNLSVNDKNQNFGTAFYHNKLVYSSTNKRVKKLTKSNAWNQKSCLQTFEAKINADDQLLDSKQISYYKKNKKIEGGPASFARQGTLMAITRNNLSAKNKIQKTKLQIYFSEFKDGKWQKDIAFSFNNSNYSTGHPCLSEDGNTMYFASDMPGGIGGIDLYVVKRKADGTWDEPVNLGSKINTEGDEMFPFYNEKNSFLFFASNGHFGLGGFDIFLANLKSPSNVKILNLGSPVNSRFDDYSFIIDKKIKKGYFSSNREGGLGDDDIYAVEVFIPFKFEKIIKGRVIDQDGNSVKAAEVTLFDKTGNKVISLIADDNAEYKFKVDPDLEFKLTASKTKYYDGSNYVSSFTDTDVIFADVVITKNPELKLYFLLTDKITKQPISNAKVTLKDNLSGKSEYFTTLESGDFTKILEANKLNDLIYFDIKVEKEGYFNKFLTFKTKLVNEGQYNIHDSLDLRVIKFEVGMDLAKILNIYPVYFDYNKFDLRPDALVELDKIIKVMNENPTMVVELGSHTDCKGIASYNLTLSENRAKSSVDYIKSKITNPDRLFSKGFGETMLKNYCSCEGFKMSKCSEDEHQLNRRTEFVILKL